MFSSQSIEANQNMNEEKMESDFRIWQGGGGGGGGGGEREKKIAGTHLPSILFPLVNACLPKK